MKNGQPPYQTLVLSPHPDDAVFSLGGSLGAGLLGRVKVINIFTCSKYTVHGLGKEEEITVLRLREDKTAMAQLGLKAEYWGFRDSSLKPQYKSEEDYMDEETLSAEDEDYDEVSERLNTLAQNHPDALLLAPLGLGNHVEHRAVASICFHLQSKGRLVAYYEDGSYFNANKDESKRLAGLLGADHSLVLTGIDLEEKLRLSSVYASQFDAEIAANLRAAYEYVGGERIWANECSFAILKRLVNQTASHLKNVNSISSDK